MPCLPLQGTAQEQQARVQQNTAGVQQAGVEQAGGVYLGF